MKRRIRDVCRNRRGEGYIDVAIGIFCLMLVVALAMTLFPVFMKKQQLDSFADEIVRQAEIVGSTDVSGRKRNFIIVKDGISPQSTSFFVHCLNVLRLDHRGIFSREHKFCAHVVDVHGLDHLAGRVVLHVDGHEHVIRGNLFDGL